MKKRNILNLLLTVFLILSFQISNCQNLKNELTVFLKRYETGKIFTTLPSGEKYMEFKINGLNEKSCIDSLIKGISAYRGVTSFKLSDEVVDGQRFATLIVYKYGDNLRYYRHLFVTNKIQHVVVDGKEMLMENLLEIEN